MRQRRDPVGVLIYELLHGSPPRNAGTRQEPELVFDPVSPRIDPVIRRATDPNMRKRYLSVDDLGGAVSVARLGAEKP